MRILLIIMLLINIAIAKKVALVIGNSGYPQQRLPNPINDAKLIANKLKDVGFDVTIKRDIKTSYIIKNVINNFAKRLKKNDIAVVYYAGHGVQYKGKNYLIMD